MTGVEVTCQGRARIPTVNGCLWVHVYTNNYDDEEHLAIVSTDEIQSKSLNAKVPGEKNLDRIIRGAASEEITIEPSRCTRGLPCGKRPDPIVRVHSECLTGDLLGSKRCDCGEQLSRSLELIQTPMLISTEDGKHQQQIPGLGVVIYLQRRERKLLETFKAYNLEDLGHDSRTAEIILGQGNGNRSYAVACAILKDLRLERIRLVTNNLQKFEELALGGILISEVVTMLPSVFEGKNEEMRLKELEQLLKAKITKMGHGITLTRWPLKNDVKARP